MGDSFLSAGRTGRCLSRKAAPWTSGCVSSGMFVPRRGFDDGALRARSRSAARLATSGLRATIGIRSGGARRSARMRPSVPCACHAAGARSRRSSALRLLHPTWGPRKIIGRLADIRPDVPWPSPSTAGEISKRLCSAVEPRRLRRRAPPRLGELTQAARFPITVGGRSQGMDSARRRFAPGAADHHRPLQPLSDQPLSARCEHARKRKPGPGS